MSGWGGSKKSTNNYEKRSQGSIPSHFQSLAGGDHRKSQKQSRNMHFVVFREFRAPSLPDACILLYFRAPSLPDTPILLYFRAPSLPDTRILSYFRAPSLPDTRILSYFCAPSLPDTRILSYFRAPSSTSRQRNHVKTQGFRTPAKQFPQPNAHF